jgi:phage protein U
MSFREVVSGQLDKSIDAFSGNDSGNAPVMMMLGGFKFSLSTAAFQEVQRSTAWRWAAIERVGKLDALQSTGPGEDRVTLPGTVYPDFRGGTGQVESLRKIMRGGRPVRLISAAGAILGFWVIESVEETASSFKPDGSPRRQDFTVVIKRFADGNVQNP